MGDGGVTDVTYFLNGPFMALSYSGGGAQSAKESIVSSRSAVRVLVCGVLFCFISYHSEETRFKKVSQNYRRCSFLSKFY